MRRRMRVLIVGLIMVLTASIAASAAAGPDLVPGNPVYLALGDSWAYGQGVPDPATGGYVGGADCLHVTESGHTKMATVFRKILES